MAATLDFLGAAGTVTGSRFLVTTPRARVLVDCGLFQGLRELRRQNWAPFPADAASIVGVVLSHAHLDHTGYVPALVRQGFAGPVFATPGTTALAAVVLRDSAHLLAEDTEHAKKHGYSKHAEPKPLYTEADVEAALRLFREVDYDTRIAVTSGIETILRPAGHILGSATVTMTVGDGSRTIVFSGDLGRPRHPLLRPPAPPSSADVMVVESTYGNREHSDDDGAARLAAAVTSTVKRGGSVVIPAFAVDRTEVILMTLRSLRDRGDIPDVPIYVDSPMALAALRIYREAIDARAPEVRAEAVRPDAFDAGNLQELRTVEESKQLNDPTFPCIIVSASGMVSGGRVLHHLAGLLPHPENTVVLAGYQAIGTRGRDLAEGARAVKIHGRYVPVHAQIVDIPMFSVHADASEVLDWLAQMPRRPDVCYVVHGEPDASLALQRRIQDELGWTAVVPRLGERVRLD